MRIEIFKKHKRDGRWYQGNNKNKNRGKLRSPGIGAAVQHPSLLFPFAGYGNGHILSSFRESVSHNDTAHAAFLLRQLFFVLVKVRDARGRVVWLSHVFL